jgi:hypothetical protein
MEEAGSLHISVPSPLRLCAMVGDLEDVSRRL